ncbi:MAG: peptidyl-prolyl cis-trans isomerase [Thermotogaceae bacterium]|nr:peptidyl-prolyl cis-trans isomerase [Thermotogaceae bacterium]
MKRLTNFVLFVIFILMIPMTLFSQQEIDILNLDPDYTVATVENQEIKARLLDTESNLPFTLLKIKETNEGFYETLLSTEAGYDFLLEYKKRVLSTLIDAYLIIQIAKDKGVQILEGDVQGYIDTFLNELLSSNNLSMEEFEQYIMTQGYDSLADYKSHLELQRKLALANYGLIDILFPDVTVSESEISNYLANNPVNTKESNSVHIYHILLDSNSDLNSVFNTINELGFEAAVLEYSKDDLTKFNNGDLGWIERGVFPEFDVAFEKNPGDVVGPLKTELGYHIIKVVEFSGGEQGQAQLRNDIRELLKREKQLTLWENWLRTDFEEESNQYSIKIFF